jgi:hypothetical protein
MNRAYWGPGIKGNRLGALHAGRQPMADCSPPPGPQNDGAYFPGLTPPTDAPRENCQSADAPEENLVNTTMETYFQDPPSRCMSCHQCVSNALGRHFIGILCSFR